MATLPTPSIDYTDKDFDALRTRVYNLISGVFPDWTDQNVANFGNLLVDAFCFVGDVLGFYLDNHARESRITTASQRRSLIALAKLVNYVPAGAAAATVEVTITAASVPAGSITIPAGTVVRTLTANPVKFQTTAAAVINALADPPTVLVEVEHSETHTENFPSTGLANQAISLARSPYLDNSAIIAADNGAYTKVDTLLNSVSSDRHYVVVVDQNDKAEVRFGNGTNGQVPSGTITATYKTGGGTVGNVEPSIIRKIEGSFTDSLSNAVVLSVTNTVAASGGSERAGIEQIRVNAPNSLRTLTRTVSRDDYEVNALRVPGVARALMLTSDSWSSIPENQGILYVIPVGGGQPSSLLKADVLTMVTVTYPNTLTFAVTVADPNYLVVDVYTKVFFRKGANKSAGAALIRTNLAAFFAILNSDGTKNTNVDFGYYYQDSAGTPTNELPFSDVYNVVRDTTGVRKIDDAFGGFLLNNEHSDIALAINRFPVLGTITILDGETDTAVV